MKSKKNLSVAVAVIFATSLFFPSCQKESDSVEETEINSSVLFMESFNKGLSTFKDAPVVAVFNGINTVSQTRGLDFVKPSDELTPIFIDLSFIDDPVNQDEIKTAGDIINLAITTGAPMSLENDGSYSDTLFLSNQECKDALSELIICSKKYLYDNGFSETDIQEMLSENNADESALVPLVTLLAEEEQNDIVNENSSITRSWAKAGHCAMHALGADVIFSLGKSGATVWSKAVIKKTFKFVATKACGIAGAALFVVDFSLCYGGVYD